MNKEEIEKLKKIFIIVFMVTLILLTFFMYYFYENHIIPKQIEVLDKYYREVFIEINRAWIDIYRGKTNFTDEDINNLELFLNEWEEEIK